MATNKHLAHHLCSTPLIGLLTDGSSSSSVAGGGGIGGGIYIQTFFREGHATVGLEEVYNTCQCPVPLHNEVNFMEVGLVFQKFASDHQPWLKPESNGINFFRMSMQAATFRHRAAVGILFTLFKIEEL
ncbi:hypothetical protein B0H11DRAFT_1927185 [Mycena galericulata]|nr:hypothetical protein B0H11DRAFT_1927185 [Mycena galericulata]